jgi:glutathione S-transferase
VLEDDAGNILFESTLILEFLDRKSGGQYFGTGTPEEWRIRRVHQVIQGAITLTVKHFQETQLRPAPSRNWTAEALDGVDTSLRWLANHGLQSAPTSVLDAVGVFLEYLEFRMPGKNWEVLFPEGRKILEALRLDPAFKNSRPK